MHLAASRALRALPARPAAVARTTCANSRHARVLRSGGAPRPPHAGTFSYVEKVEYWAFLWGTVLMTVTGLLLWFENATPALPAQVVTDVATAIHFYEAVLATLAILVWHLYWVIFDPDVYPMDWSWWTGRSPEARIRERREAEPPTPPSQD